ncbi:MAG: hypothetical protein IKH84_02300, partial [Ottowia sp.]|nr:hypothetical protein [Ottowia sp.]
MVLALPTREYSREELELIFRHESVHLMRQDNIFKFSRCARALRSRWAHGARRRRHRRRHPEGAHCCAAKTAFC